MAKQIMYRTVKDDVYGPWRKPLPKADGNFVLPAWIVSGGFDNVEIAEQDEFRVGDKFSMNGYTVTIVGDALAAKYSDGETYNQYPTTWVDSSDDETFHSYVSEINLSRYERA